MSLSMLWQDLTTTVPTVEPHGGTGGLSTPTATGPAHHNANTTTPHR